MELGFMRGAAALITFGAVLSASAGGASAEEQEPSVPDNVKIVLNDGTVVGIGETVTLYLR